MHRRIARRHLERLSTELSDLHWRGSTPYLFDDAVSERQVARIADDPDVYAELGVPELDELQRELEEERSIGSWSISTPEGESIATVSERHEDRYRERYPESDGYTWTKVPSRRIPKLEAKIEELEAERERRRREWSSLIQTGDISYQMRSEGKSFRLRVLEDRFEVGHVHVFHLGASNPPSSDVAKLKPDCLANLADASEYLGFDPEVFMVYSTQLFEELRGRGVGTDMYVEAAREAADRGGVLLPDLCHPHYGSTSEAALRVWRGSEFRSRVQLLSEWIAWGG